MRWTKENRGSPAHLLPLWDIVDDTIVTTHGYYLRGLEITGIDSENLDYSIVARSGRLLYEDAKSEIPTDCLFQFIVRSHSDYSDIFDRFKDAPQPDNSVLQHQRERRTEFLKEGNLRRHSIYLFIGSKKGFTSKEFASISTKAHANKVGKAKELQKSVRRMFERADLQARPIEEDELLTLFHQGIDPGASHPPRIADEFLAAEDHVIKESPSLKCLSLREQILSKPIRGTADEVRIGKRYYKVLTLKSLPDETRFAAMEIFLHLNFDFRLSVNFSMPKQSGLKTKMKYMRRLTNTYAFRNSYVQEEEDLSLARQAKQLSELLADTGQKMIMAGMQLVLWGDSKQELERRVEQAIDTLKPYDFTFYEETGEHHKEVFKSLPGMAASFDRWKLVSTNLAVDLMPVFGACNGDRRPVFMMKTARGELFNYDPVEPIRDNKSGMVLGASGAGKSVFMNMLITTAMLSNSTRGKVMVVDFAGETKSSYLMIAKLFGGRFIPILSEKEDTAINPFPPPSRALDDAGEVNTKTMNFLMVLTDILLINTGEDKDSQLYRNILQKGIVDTYRQCNKEADEAPIYSSLLRVLETYRNTDVDQERLTVLLELMRGFIDSPNAKLFNRPSNIQTEEDFLIFDLYGIEGLQKNVAQALTFLVCQYVKDLAYGVENKGTKYIILDEVAQLLRRPEMVELVKELYSTGRKHGDSIWTITQEYASYVESAVAETINLNSTTKIFLSHETAAIARDRIVKDFELNEREAYLFSSLDTKKGYYSEALIRTVVFDDKSQTKTKVSSKVRIELSPFDYELATSDDMDRALQDKFLKANKDKPLVKVLDYIAYRHKQAA